MSVVIIILITVTTGPPLYCKIVFRIDIKLYSSFFTHMTGQQSSTTRHYRTHWYFQNKVTSMSASGFNCNIFRMKMLISLPKIGHLSNSYLHGFMFELYFLAASLFIPALFLFLKNNYLWVKFCPTP